jgi:heme oxygenase
MSVSQQPTMLDRPACLQFSDRLRAQTGSTHERLDQSIMAAKPFAGIENYGRFLKVQHGIHFDVEPLYHSPFCADVLPDLRARGRIGAVVQDIADIGLALPDVTDPPATESVDMPEALGWLYVIEGSNLGAAFLLKYAKKMGLSETYGARHLAEPLEGRAPYWRAFKEALNGIDLSASDEARAIAAAEAAFARVRHFVRLYL